MYTRTHTHTHTFSFPGDPVVKLLPTYDCSEAVCLVSLAQFSAVISIESCSLEMPMDLISLALNVLKQAKAQTERSSLLL